MSHIHQHVPDTRNIREMLKGSHFEITCKLFMYVFAIQPSFMTQKENHEQQLLQKKKIFSVF